MKAANSEKGLQENPLEYVWVSGRPTTSQPDSATVDSKSRTPSEPLSSFVRLVVMTISNFWLAVFFVLFQNPFAHAASVGLVTDSDFEDIVLMKMRQAAERKRLLAEMEQNERNKASEDGCEVID